jgi:hypothetical protein
MSAIIATADGLLQSIFLGDVSHVTNAAGWFHEARASSEPLKWQHHQHYVGLLFLLELI